MPEVLRDFLYNDGDDQLQADNIASWQPDMQMDDVFDA